jgi:hypothetical protein
MTELEVLNLLLSGTQKLSAIDFRRHFAIMFPMSATSWVVTCTACKCIITCFAIDPQAEHGRELSPVPPQSSCVLQCPCCDSAYRYTAVDMKRGTPKRNPTCLRKAQRQPLDGALLVAATMVAAMRQCGYVVSRSRRPLKSFLLFLIQLHWHGWSWLEWRE